MNSETTEKPRLIPSSNFPAAIYLSELHTQCTIIRGAVKRLQAWAPEWPRNPNRPLHEVIADLYVTLSALAMISKLLLVDSGYPKGKGDRASQRRARLRELIGVAEGMFPWLSSRIVRNHIEHMDERLDQYFEGFSGSGTVSHLIHLGPPTGKPNQFVPRWLDPTTLQFGSLEDTIDLIASAHEVDLLDQMINEGLRRLAAGEFLLWPAEIAYSPQQQNP